MDPKNWLAAAIAASAALLAPAVQAGPMFRCGNIFQDRPCEAGVKQEVVNPGKTGPLGSGVTSAPTAATRASAHAGVCGRIGEHAQRMVWQREGGATLERQTASLPAGPDRQELQLVLESVYAKRGSAVEIRGQVEAECVQRKVDAANAAAALRDLQQRAGQPGGVTPAAAPAAAPTAQAQAAPAGAAAAPQTANAESPACPGLREQRAAIENRLRSGGSAQTMEMYQRQRRETEKRMAEAGCQ